MSFKLLVLRFMSIIIRAQYLGDWSKGEMTALLSDIVDEIEEVGRNGD